MSVEILKYLKKKINQNNIHSSERICSRGELSCYLNVDGYLILDCCEYVWKVNYCPFCGKKALKELGKEKIRI